MKKQRLIGIVLCGGKSSRMGNDKAFLIYYDQPQLFHVSEMLNQLCDEIVFSVSEEQLHLINTDQKTITDIPSFANHGPISGLLSVANHFPQSTFLLIGCDYPLLAKADLESVISNFTDEVTACGILNPDTKEIEPLLCLYSSKAIKELQGELERGNDSLRKYLKNINAKGIPAISPMAYRSIDTPEEFREIRLSISNN